MVGAWIIRACRPWIFSSRRIPILSRLSCSRKSGRLLRHRKRRRNPYRQRKRTQLADSRSKPWLAAFGPGQVAIDIQRHRRRAQEAANQALLDLADARGLSAVATGGVRHARAPRRALLDVLTCIREKRTLADAGRLLAENALRFNLASNLIRSQLKLINSAIQEGKG